MFCRKCGNQVADGTLFCQFCGTALGNAAQDTAAQGGQPQGFQDNSGQGQYQQWPEMNQQYQQGQDMNQQFQQEPGMNQQFQSGNGMNYDQNYNYGQNTGMGAPASGGKQKKPFNKKALIITLASVGGVLLLVALFFIIKGLMSGGNKSSTAYVYATEKTLYLVKDANRPVSISLGNTKCDNEDLYNQVWFTDDGKYVYFFTKAEEDEDSYFTSGTLNRAEISKLKGKDSDSKYIETIANNVRLDIYLIGNDGLFYRDAKSTLYYYNGKEEVKVDKNIDNVYFSQNKDYLFYLKKDDEDEKDLYYVTASKPEETTKIESDVDYLIYYDDVDHLLFERYDDENYEYILYSAGINSSSEKLGSGADEFKSYDYDTKNGYSVHEIYYLVNSGETLLPKDLVDTSGIDDDYLLEDLENDYYELQLKELYKWNNGKPEKLDDGILGYDTIKNGVIYNKADEMEKLDGEDIEYASDVTYGFEVNYTEGNHVLDTYSGKMYQLSGKADDLWLELGESYSYLRMIMAKDKVYIYNNIEFELYELEIDGSKLGNPTLLLDECKLIDSDDGDIYYSDDYYSSGDESYINIYSYKNGKSELLASDVTATSARIFEDGIIYGYTDYSKDTYELSVFGKDGKGAVIADDVTGYTRLDSKNMLYISDDDLYLYNGKEPRKIDSDVVRIYPMDEYMPSEYLYYYEY